jgi:ketosteroid isomerase-like protein
MAMKRPTMRQLSDARKRQRREEIQAAIADGRLTVRQMTPQERKEADAHRRTRTRARTTRGASRVGS